MPDRLSLRMLLAMTLCGAAALALTARPARAAKPAVMIDEVWSSPDLGRRDIQKIAILPAVALDTYSADHPLSDSLAAAFRNDGRRWMHPLSTWHGLGESEIERLAEFRKVADEVRDRGRLKPVTASRLAERLGVDALLVTRIDRWERSVDSSDQTSVEARAELVDPAGAPLWRVVGRSRVYSTVYRPRADLPKPSQGNKLTDSQVSGGGGGSNGGSGGSSGGSTPVAGSAGQGGNSGGGSQSSQPPPRVPKLEYKETPLEDLVRARDPGQPEFVGDPFARAAGLLVAAWATKRPAAWVATGADQAPAKTSQPAN